MADRPKQDRAARVRLSLDWWAVITALAVALLVWLNVIGNVAW